MPSAACTDVGSYSYLLIFSHGPSLNIAFEGDHQYISQTIGHILEALTAPLSAHEHQYLSLLRTLLTQISKELR